MCSIRYETLDMMRSYFTQQWRYCHHTWTQIVLNLYAFLCSPQHKKRYFEKWSNQFLVLIVSHHSEFLFHTREVMGAWLGVNCLITSIVPNILFCIQPQKKSHSSLEQQQNFHFWVNYSSKAAYYSCCCHLCPSCISNIRKKITYCPWLTHFCKINKNECILNICSGDHSVYLLIFFIHHNIIQCFKYFK